MEETGNRVAAFLSSPIGCEFLSLIEEEGFTPETAAVPHNSLWLAVLAVHAMEVWCAEHDDDVARSLANGERLGDLAHTILAHPGTAWWFDPVDLNHQVWISHEGHPPDTAGWVRLGSPPGVGNWGDQHPGSHQNTSTLHGLDASLLVAYSDGVGDFMAQFPLQCWGPPDFAGG